MATKLVRKTPSKKTNTSGRESVADTYNRAVRVLNSDPAGIRGGQPAVKEAGSSGGPKRDDRVFDNSPVITAESIKPRPTSVIPTPNVYNPGDVVTAGNTGIATASQGAITTSPTGGLVPALPQAQDTGYQSIQNYLQSETQKAQDEMISGEERYAKLVKDNKEKQLQQEVNDYSGQINAIQANAQSQQLALEGQGRGQTAGFIGGEQARINREAAIAALPVQAQLAAAQGNLQMAQAHIDRMFDIQSRDAQTKYENRINLIQSVAKYATEEQNRLLAAKEKAEDRAFQTFNTDQAFARQLALQAGEYGQISLAGKIGALDLKTEAGKAQLNVLASQLRKPVATSVAKAPDLQNFGTATDPQWKQYDTATGQWVDIKGLTSGSTATNQSQAESLTSKVQEIKGLTTHKGLNSAVGAVGLGRVGIIDAFGAKDQFIGKVEQLVSQEFLDSLISAKAKGATFGALTKPEQDALTASATAIGQWRMTDKDTGRVTGYDVDEKSFKAELVKLQNLAQKAANKAAGYDLSLVTPADDQYINSISILMNQQNMSFNPSLDYK